MKVDEEREGMEKKGEHKQSKNKKYNTNAQLVRKVVC